MRFHLKSNGGFTLLEMLVVLCIVIVVSSMVYQFSYKLTQKQEIDLFFSQVQLDIQRAQAFAIESGKYTTVQFSNNYYYAFQGFNSDKIFEKQYPVGIGIKQDSTYRKVQFNPNGEVVDFGTISFITPIGLKQLIINIEKGRIKFVQ